MALKSISINSEMCTGCSLCVNDCPGGCIKLTGSKAEFKAEKCMECGHCFAICPVGAVSMNNYDTSNCAEVTDFTQIDSETFLQAVKSRRTVRNFTDEPVEQCDIDKILEAGRYAPTGANAQDVHYTILGSKQDEVEAECIKLFRKGLDIAKPVAKAVSSMNIDDKFFFKGAPLVIVVTGKSSVNAGLASAYMELMANTLGLGVLYSGFFVICSKISPKIRKLIKLQKGEKVISCMIIGHSKVRYKRIAPRKNLKVTKL